MSIATNGATGPIKAPKGKALKLHIGHAAQLEKGFQRFGSDPGADFAHDLNFYPWPLEDGSVSELVSRHYVERIPLDVTDAAGTQVDGLVAFMNECHRVLRSGRQLRIWHVYLKHNLAFADPTFRRQIPEDTWHFFNREWRAQNDVAHYPISANFEIANIVAHYAGDWGQRAIEAQQFAVQHHFNVAAILEVHLTKRA